MSVDGVRTRAVGARPGGFGLVALGAVLWGTGGLAGVQLAETSGLSSSAVAACRLLTGGILLLAVLAVGGRLADVPRTTPVLRRVAATAVLAALYQGCYFAAVPRAGVATSTLVALGSAPVLVALAVAVATRRRPPTALLVALVLALAGLALLVGPTADGRPRDAVGVVLALGAGTAFAALTLLNTRPVPGLGALPLTGLAFSAGGLLLAGVVLGTGAGALVPQDGAGWGLLVFLGAVPTAAAYAAYFSGLRTVPATTAALLALLEPLAATVGAVLLRGERLGWTGVVGAVLLVLAVTVLRPRP